MMWSIFRLRKYPTSNVKYAFTMLYDTFIFTFSLTSSDSTDRASSINVNYRPDVLVKCDKSSLMVHLRTRHGIFPTTHPVFLITSVFLKFLEKSRYK
ncbi:hypothetical protein Q1695_005589 [Nippostrongylus brasiliensis]|nr:hypothetical protein Q1695_005589 [Nippostrongylus brasiliensis]